MKKGWQTKRLGDVVTRLTNGFVGPTRNIYHESGIPYLLARHVRNNNLLFDGRTFITDEFNQKNKKSMLKAGDVLLVQSGHIGHSAVVTEEHEGHNCHAMIVISPVKDAITGPYLSLFFNSPDMERGFEEIRSGSTVPHLTCGAVKELQIPVPPLAEQQRIVGLLDEAFEGLATAKANAEKNLQNARALFESHLQSVFTQRGPGWKQKTLEEIATTFGRGKSKHRPRNEPKLYDGNYPFIQMATSETLTISSRSIPRLIANSGSPRASFGQSGQSASPSRQTSQRPPSWASTLASRDSVIGVVANPKEAEVGFIEYLLQSFKARIQALGKGSAQANINMGTFENERFPFPPVAEQRQIVEKLDSLSEETERLARLYERKIAALEALKKSLLHQAFTGEL